MMKSVSLAKLAIAAAAALSNLAFADVGIRHEAGFSNVQLGVIDLTPNDGNAAGYTVGTVDTVHWLRINTQETVGDDVYLYETVSGQGPSAYHDAFRSGDVGTTVNGVGQFSATASAGRDLGVYGGASSSIEQRITVTLAAHAMLTFSGDFYRSAVLGDAADTQFAAYAGEQVHATDSTTRWTLSENRLFTIPGQPRTDSFWYAIANTTDSATTVYLTLAATAGVGVRQPALAVSPVPEPATYAMLLAGLGVAGIAARRRRA